MKWLSELAIGGAVSGLAIVLSVPAFAESQVAQSQPDTQPAATSTRASDLVVLPRFGVGHTSSGGGFDGFTRLEGFVPLQQTPSTLLFVEGRFLVDNDANPGGNVLLGYRTYNTVANRLLGGYIAYDNRNTGKSVFSQIGFGLEMLGERWDIRANAYFPIGNTRQITGESLFDSGFQASNLRFQDRFLVVSGSRQQQLIRDREAAMTGADLEAGGRLLRFANGGDLRGYAGLYYYTARGSSATVGVRGRLEARPINNLTLGLAVQHDDLFGTNVVASVGLTFPGSRPRGIDPTSVLARLGESPFRTGTIVVDTQRQVQTLNQQVTDTALINPATGQPYLFQQVVLGQAGGNGTIEQPFGQIQSALDATTSDGNDIVYVQAGSNSGITGFTIPDRVQVLSNAPVQLIDTAQFGQIQLPLSGAGLRPLVTNTITLGNDTVLSGFTVTSTTGAGITFNDVSRVEIRDNTIANTADSGILGNGVLEATVVRNQITATQNQGIFLQNAGTVTVADNTVTNTIAGTTSIANPIVGNITIPNPLGGGAITIPNPGSIIPLPSGQGIVIATVSGKADILRNTVTGTGTQGIVLLNATDDVAIADNVVANTVGNNVTVNVPILGNLAIPSGQGIVVGGVTDQNLEIARNTITDVRGQGLVVAGASGTANITSNTIQRSLDQGLALIGNTSTTTIAGNQILDTATRNVIINNPLLFPPTLTFATGQGIALINSIGTIAITSNTIERTAGGDSTNPLPDSGQGIVVANFTGQLDLNVTNNQIRSNFNDGILIGLGGTTPNAATANITITGNTLENNGGAAPFIRGDGIGIGLEQSAIVNSLLIENNTIRGNGDEGIDIRLGQLHLPVLPPSNAQLSGVIRSNTISSNAQNGIQVESGSNTQATVTIEANTISTNGFQGISLQTFSQNAKPQLSTTVRLNILTNNANPGVLIRTNNPGTQTLCVNLASNNSNTGYELNGTAAPVQVVNSGNNIGTIVQTGTVVNAASCQ